VKRKKSASGMCSPVSNGSEVEETKNGTREASFEAKTFGDSLAGLGGRRGVVGDGEWCVGGSGADGRIAASDPTTSSDHSR
jgi:hypothetical protein